MNVHEPGEDMTAAQTDTRIRIGMLVNMPTEASDLGAIKEYPISVRRGRRPCPDRSPVQEGRAFDATGDGCVQVDFSVRPAFEPGDRTRLVAPPPVALRETAAAASRVTASTVSTGKSTSG